jgi:HK97 family phage portal protein
VIIDRLLGGGAEEERAVSFQSLFALGDGYTFTTNSGVYVTQEDSLKIGAVYSCVRLIADTIASLPVDSYIRQEGVRLQYRPRPAWLDAPDIGVTREDHFQQVLVSLLLNGNSFTRIIRDEDGEVLALSVMNPQRVEVRRDAANRLFYVYDARDRIEDVDMIHIKDLTLPGELRGKSRIDLVKENLGLSRALEEFAARFFGQGSSTTGIIQFPGNLSREQAKNLVDAFEDGHKGLRRSHRPGILFGGATFQKTGVDPNESQFLESRQFAVEEIARIFRVPPSMIGVTTPGAMSYASVEANQLHFLQHTLTPYLSKLESEYSVLLAGRAFIRFTTAGLLRGDIAARNASYSSGLANGYLSVNDVRRYEDMSPIDGGDVYRVPLTNIDITAANLADLDRKSAIAQRLIASGFQPAAVLAALDMPAIEHTGVPTNALQPLSMVSPADPQSAYEVK